MGWWGRTGGGSSWRGGRNGEGEVVERRGEEGEGGDVVGVEGWVEMERGGGRAVIPVSCKTKEKEIRPVELDGERERERERGRGELAKGGTNQ